MDEKLNETITKILVTQGKHEIKLESIYEKVEDLSVTVKENNKTLAETIKENNKELSDKIDSIQNNALSDVRKNNEWYRSTLFKAILIITGLSGGVFGVVEIVKAFGG